MAPASPPLAAQVGRDGLGDGMIAGATDPRGDGMVAAW